MTDEEKQYPISSVRKLLVKMFQNAYLHGYAAGIRGDSMDWENCLKKYVLEEQLKNETEKQ